MWLRDDKIIQQHLLCDKQIPKILENKSLEPPRV